MNELDQLKKLILDGNFEAESKQVLADYERQLSELLIKEKAIENPVIKEFVDYLQLQIEKSEQKLKTDRQLDLRERDALFAKIDTCNHFLSLFNGKAREELRQQIIKDLEYGRNQ